MSMWKPSAVIFGIFGHCFVTSCQLCNIKLMSSRSIIPLTPADTQEHNMRSMSPFFWMNICHITIAYYALLTHLSPPSWDLAFAWNPNMAISQSGDSTSIPSFLAFHVVVVVVLVLVLVLFPGIIVMVLVVLEEYQSIQSEALFLSEQFWIKPTTMRLNPSFSVARYVVVGATILTNLLLNMATLLRDGSRSFVVTIGGDICIYIYYNIITVYIL